MFRIGEFSKMSKTTVKALRYYDEVGLLKPEQVDERTGYRLYTTGQMVRLHHIRALQQAGLSIDEIKQLLAGEDTRPVLEARRGEILERLAGIQRQLSQIEFILQEEEEGMFMNYAANVKQLPECIVYSKKMTVPDYSVYFQVIPAIGAEVTAKYPDLSCAVPEYCFIRYLDGEYREKDINVEFCEAVIEQKPDFDGISFRKMESVTAVTVLHKGDYADLPGAYAFAFRWIEENGYEPAEEPREQYIDGIWNKEKVADWLTELQIPIVKKGR